MGIIALTLFLATTKIDAFQALPGWLEFLRTPKFDIATWVKDVCAVTMAFGVSTGGWRIIKTLGKNMAKLEPVHGFSAQTTASMVLEAATSLGIPLSTTHDISGAVMGVGATRRLNAVKWSVAERMLWAWVMTLPIAAASATGWPGWCGTLDVGSYGLVPSNARILRQVPSFICMNSGRSWLRVDAGALSSHVTRMFDGLMSRWMMPF